MPCDKITLHQNGQVGRDFNRIMSICRMHASIPDAVAGEGKGERMDAHGRQRRVVYAVPAGAAKSISPHECRPHHLADSPAQYESAFLARLPCTQEGFVDEETLERISVIDEALGEEDMLQLAEGEESDESQAMKENERR